MKALVKSLFEVNAKDPQEISSKQKHWKKFLVYGVLSFSIFYVLFKGWVFCPSAFVFRLPCPGCGSSRAMHAFFVGDFSTFMRMNPCALPVSAGFAVLWATFGISLLKEGSEGKESGAFFRIRLGRVEKFIMKWLVFWSCVEIGVWIFRFFGFLGGPVSV